MAFFQIAAAAMTVVGVMQAGKAQQIASEQQAKQMEIDRKVGEAQAMALRNQRIAEYNSARATNNAQFSFQTGGGESTSIDAFKRKQRRTLESDVVASQRQSALESSSRTVGALLERQRGANAMYAAKINSMSTIFQLGADLQKTKGG